MSVLSQWRSRTFPDLERFDTAEAGRRAFAQATWDVCEAPGLAVLWIAWAVIVAFLLVTGHVAVALAISGSVGCIVAFLLPLLLRGVVARSLWRQLAEQGRACCTQCGYDLRGTESGQCPECGMDHVRAIANLLERREQLHRLKFRAMVVFGLPLSLLGPVVLATMFWLALLFFSRSVYPSAAIPWLTLFIFFTVIVVPLLYRLELRSHGRYLVAVLRETDVSGSRGAMFTPGIGREIAAFSVIVANPRLASSMFIEFFLLGPRLVLGGVRRARLGHAVAGTERRRAAKLVLALLNCDGGAKTASLQNDDESASDLIPLLAYLTFYGWTGVGEKWERVWLYSESRRYLNAFSGSPFLC